MLVIVGAAAGAAGSIFAGRALASQLYGLSPTDAMSIASPLLLLLGTAVLAIWLPARRATRIQPIVALRE
jgi:ABC-type antimicrobial peptide transport system permease subunit